MGLAKYSNECFPWNLIPRVLYIYCHCHLYIPHRLQLKVSYALWFIELTRSNFNGVYLPTQSIFIVTDKRSVPISKTALRGSKMFLGSFHLVKASVYI